MVTLEIMEFVERNILPRYNDFGSSHGLRHVQNVIAQSLVLAEKLGANTDMCYVVAAYHDLGLSGPRAIHHITSGKILASDARLKRWFSAEQIKIMKEACEDHRASSSHQPRSIYGKIVAEADRELEPETVFIRTIQYSFEHYPEMSDEEHWRRFSEHLTEKYSDVGYIHLWIPNSPNQERLSKLRAFIRNKEKLREEFDRLYPVEKERFEKEKGKNP